MATKKATRIPLKCSRCNGSGWLDPKTKKERCPNPVHQKPEGSEADKKIAN